MEDVVSPRASRRRAASPPSSDAAATADEHKTAAAAAAPAEPVATGRKRKAAAAAAADSPVDEKKEEESPAAAAKENAEVQAPPSKRGRRPGASTTSVTKEAAADNVAATPTKRRGSASAAAAAEARPSSPSRAASPPPAAAAAAAPAVIHHPRISVTGIDLSVLLGAGFEKSVARLGGELVDDVHLATHLLTDRVRRTDKALIAFSCTPFLLTHHWLEESIKQGKFLPADKFLLKDPEAEEKWGFKLSERSTSASFLSGVSVFATPSVRPAPAQLRAIVQAAGGKWLSKAPSGSPAASGPLTLIISAAEDEKQWRKLAAAGHRVHGSEIILTGVLRQRLDFGLAKLG